MLTIPICSIMRSKRIDAILKVHAVLLICNLGHVDVLDGRYVVALGRDREQAW